MVLENCVQRNKRKAWTAITKRHWCIGIIRQTCLTPFRRTNGGDCLIADNSLYLPRRTCYDARNTECCMPDCFSTNPTLSPRQTAVIEAVRKE